MSRILSRGKRKDNGEWACGDHVVINGREHRIYTGYAEADCDELFPDWYEVVPETVVHYTTITDSKGEPIFVGDIVKAPKNLSKTEFYIGTIEFGNFTDHGENTYTGFYIKWHNVYKYDTLRQSIIWWRDTEGRFLRVIGNVFDNPELIRREN